MKSKYFIIQEFVPRSIFERFGNDSTWFIDPNLVAFCDWLREFTAQPITINTWHRAGVWDNCGFRPPSTTTGASLSQHRFGRAVDLHVANYAAEQIRNIIRLNFRELNEKFGITTIEKDTPSWVHVDTRWTGKNELLEVPQT